MAKQVWVCDNCGSSYTHHNEASQCEHSHRARMTEATIAGSKFGSLDNTYGIDRGQRQMYPQTIRVKFSDKHNDFAMYKLERIGARGV